MSHIAVSGLAYAHPGGDLLFSDVSFRVAPGRHAGLVGTNGVGKSTLLRILAGEPGGGAGGGGEGGRGGAPGGGGGGGRGGGGPGGGAGGEGPGRRPGSPAPPPPRPSG